MKTLIIFATKHGCTDKCTHKLKDRLTGEIEVLNMNNSDAIHLEKYDMIIIGGSIHAGRIQKSIKMFCLNHLDELKKKKTGLFICCMEEGEKAIKQLNEAFPEELVKHASAVGVFGGEFNFQKMNFIEKFIVKKIAKVSTSVSKISEENIAKFVEQIS